MELLVAIAILGILATIAISAINPIEQLKKSRDAKRFADLRNLQTAIETYKIRKGKYPETLSVLITSGEINNEIKDPNGSSYLYSIDNPLNPTKYCLCAKTERNANKTHSEALNGICQTGGDKDRSCLSPAQ